MGKKCKKQKCNQKKAYQDSNFHVSEVSDVDETCEETFRTTNDVQEPDKAAFIVYWNYQFYCRDVTLGVCITSCYY